MAKIKCFIVEDEDNAMQALCNIIRRDFEKLEIVGTASTVDEAEVGIKKTLPDVIFLDIILPVHSGFELIKRFDTIPFEIVFITSHTEYALQAIQNLAVAYLLKPVSTTEFAKMVDILHKRFELFEKKKLYDTLIHNISANKFKDQKIAININNKTEFIRIGDIVRVEGWNRYSKIFTTQHKAFVSSYNIGKFFKLLENQSFFLVHKSHLINMDYIVHLLPDDKILMSDQSQVPLSLRKRSEFMASFEKIGTSPD